MLDFVEDVVDHPHAAAEALGTYGAQVAHAAHVLPGGKSAARAGDNENPQIIILDQRGDSIAQLLAHLEVPGVEIVRPVQAQDSDLIAPVESEEFILGRGHGKLARLLGFSNAGSRAWTYVF